MKKYNYMLSCALLFYLSMAGLLLFLFRNEEKQEGSMYRVEVHRILREMQENGGYGEPDLMQYPSIAEVSFLEKTEADQEKEGRSFFSQEIENTVIEPLYIEGKLLGYVRFGSAPVKVSLRLLFWSELVLFAMAAGMILFLLYLDHRLLRPFQSMMELPYELARGHFGGELKENKSRYFGRFIWGLSMLQDHLNDYRAKELKLEREKKLLLLSISHDIKTPLNAIKLYAKALAEGVYQEETEKREAAARIGRYTEEIEQFVKEIVKTSSEDILHIEVIEGEFYLKDFMDKLLDTYREKCRLKLTEFKVGDYQNKLMKGDFDRSFEVFENLMENAFKYGDGREIRIDFQEEEYCQLIGVSNTGIPVEEMEMPHLFDSFFRGKNAAEKQGNGLGLYICREIMHRMDGEIFAERQERGMRFVMVLRE